MLDLIYSFCIHCEFLLFIHCDFFLLLFIFIKSHHIYPTVSSLVNLCNCNL
jgi:hypothetical protein